MVVNLPTSFSHIAISGGFLFAYLYGGDMLGRGGIGGVV